MKTQFVRKLSEGIPQHIVCYGCSLTASGAWVNHLQTALEEKYPLLSTVTNSGQDGMWSKWGLENIRNRVIEKSPNVVFIEFAMNDAYLAYETSVAQARRYLCSMIDDILQNNDETEIILMIMNPPTGEHLAVRPNFNEYNQMYRHIAKERKLMLIDHQPTWESILNKGIEEYLRYVPDGIHPSSQGSKKIIIPHLLACLGI